MSKEKCSACGRPHPMGVHKSFGECFSCINSNGVVIDPNILFNAETPDDWIESALLLAEPAKVRGEE